MFFVKNADRVKYTQHGNPGICKDCQPHGSKSCKSKNHDDRFDNKGKYYILPRNLLRCFCNFHSLRNGVHTGIHKYHICRFNGGVCSASHCRSYICSCKNRCIVDPVSYKHDRFVFFSNILKLRYLILWKKTGVYLLNTCLLCNCLRLF